MKPKFALLAAFPSGRRVTVKGKRAPEGASRFYVRYTRDGVRCMEPLGSDFLGALDELRRFEARKTYEQTTGEKLPENFTVDPVKKALAAEVKAWLESKAITPGIASATPKRYRYALDLFVDFASREKITCASDIVRDDLFRFAAYLRAEGYKPQTVYLSFASVMIFLKGVGILLRIPKKQWGKPVPSKAQRYTDEELDAMFSVGSAEETLLLKSFLFTGMRNQELAHLTHEDINFRDSIWTVQPKQNWNPKTHESVREIAVPPVHTEAIRERMIRDGRGPKTLVFPTTYGTPNVSFIRILKRVAKRAGVTSRVYIHKFRSTAATLWLRDGLDIDTVARQLGHADLKTIRQYIEMVKLASEETRERTARTFRRWTAKADPESVIPFRATGT